MKKLLVIAIALASVNAFATRARMMSLGNSPHLVDTQTIYTNPSDIHYVGGDFVSLESGTNNAGTTANTNAEGMVVRTMGDAKLGLSLGHQSTNASNFGLRNGFPNFTGLANSGQQNPIELTYGMKSGDMAWAGTLVYSNYNNKVAGEKESSAGIRFGGHMGAIDYAIGFGLLNTAENALTGAAQPAKLKGTMGISGDVGYTMDSMYTFAKLVTAGVKVENAAGNELANVTAMDITVGAVNSHKKEGSEFFYGAALANTSQKNSVGDSKSNNLQLPIWLGLEVDASSWLTLRGSVTQTLPLLDNQKEEAGGTASTDFSPGPNSTVAAFGAGLKFNKLTLDGTLMSQSAGAQTVSTNNLLGQVGMTYMF